MARLAELGIDFDHWCFACGRANPYGLHLDFEVARDRAMTRFTALREHTGYDGAVHGGIVSALLDETMGWAIFHQASGASPASSGSRPESRCRWARSSP